MAQTLVFDADDTLWENNVYFERVVDDYLAWIAHPTLDRATVRGVLDDIERANTATHGYGSEAFLRNLHECFERLSERPATGDERRAIDDIATGLAEVDVELMPGIAETLEVLGERHRLFLVTKGAQAEQERKIAASGLAAAFHALDIVPEKNPDVYRELTARRGWPVESTWMIGNSPRSDIRAARSAGLRAVFIPNPHTWSLEEEALDPDDAGVVHLTAFRELLEHF